MKIWWWIGTCWGRCESAILRVWQGPAVLPTCLHHPPSASWSATTGAELPSCHGLRLGGAAGRCSRPPARDRLPDARRRTAARRTACPAAVLTGPAPHARMPHAHIGFAGKPGRSPSGITPGAGGHRCRVCSARQMPVTRRAVERRQPAGAARPSWQSWRARYHRPAHRPWLPARAHRQHQAEARRHGAWLRQRAHVRVRRTCAARNPLLVLVQVAPGEQYVSAGVHHPHMPVRPAARLRADYPTSPAEGPDCCQAITNRTRQMGAATTSPGDWPNRRQTASPAAGLRRW